MPLIAQNPKPRVILGLMTFGPPGTESDGTRIDSIDTFKEALDVLQKRGYNEIDTARIYVKGKQEAWTREAGWKEKGFTLATKVKYPSEPGDNTADKVVESVQKSLEELGTDCVDVSSFSLTMVKFKPLTTRQILYLHRPDRAVPFAETLEAIDKLHKAGKFVRFGVSNFTAFEVAEVVMTCKYNNWVRPTIYQGMYNIITRSIEPELVVACRRYGLDIVVYNPIAGGLFSGKIKSKDIEPTSGRFSDSTGMGANYRARYFRDSTFKSLQLVENAAEKHNLTMIETALRWMVHHSALKIKDGNDGIIVGVSSVAQLENNLDNIEKGPLPDEVVKALDEAWQVSKADTANYWHGDAKYSYDTHEALFAAGAK